MLRGLAVALAASAVLVCAASSGASTAAQTFTDPAGDQQGTAPDVTTVVVSHTASGNISWRITIANQPTLAADSEVYILIDTDRNPATGAPDTLGSEYFFYIDGSDRTFGLGRWTGSEFDFDAPADTATVTYENGVAGLTINRSELGNTNGFNFWVRGIQHTGPETSNIDDAPDGDNAYSYLLTPVGPPQGTVARKSIQPVRNGMRATFTFRTPAVAGSRVQIVWRVRGRQYAGAASGPARTVSSTVIGLGRGLYVAQLRVRTPGAAWRTISTVQRRR